ncbi:MAG: hypothetical protein P1V81_00035 [Planctomycetota bacterium]|nr:hypothetical protein [Planctomycetota bacterium]
MGVVARLATTLCTVGFLVEVLDLELLRPVLGPLLLGLAGLALLCRLAPREPDMLKLLLFSVALSPMLALGVWLLLRLVAPEGVALSGTYVLLLAMQVGSGRGEGDGSVETAGVGDGAARPLGLGPGGARRVGPGTWLLACAPLLLLFGGASISWPGVVSARSPEVILVLATLALLPLLLAKRVVGAPPEGAAPGAGRAAFAALTLAVCCALVVGLALFAGPAIRASFHGLLHSSITEEVARSVPPENPWLAGRPLPYYWAWHGLGALVGGALGLAPTLALALLNVWAAFLVPLALYFLAAPLLREPKRDLAAVLLGLFGLNVLGGWLLLSSRPELVPPDGPLALLEQLRALVSTSATELGAVDAWDARLAWGPSKFGNLSSYPVSLALLLCGWLASGHALRGRWGRRTDASGRTWAILAALTLGASLVMNPLVGAAGFAATGLVALLRGRLLLLGALAIAAIPGALEVLAAASHRTGASFELRFDGGAIWSSLLPVLPLLVCALPLFWRRPWTSTSADVSAGSNANAQASADAGAEVGGCVDPSRLAGDQGPDPAAEGPRSFFLLLIVAAALSLVVAAFVVFPEDNQYKFVRLAAFPLAILAAGGLGVLFAARDLTARGFAFAAALFLVVGATTSTWWGGRAYAAWSQVEVPLVEADGVLLPGGDGDLAAGFAELRRALGRMPAGTRPVLLVGLGERGSRSLMDLEQPISIDDATFETWTYDGHRFRGAHNLQGHEAAAFSGMSLFTDERSYLVDADPAWKERMQALEQLAVGQGPSALLARRLEQLERPAFVLHEGQLGSGWLPSELSHLIPTSFDNSILPDPGATFDSLGFEVLWQRGDVTIYADGRARAALEEMP